MHTVQAQLVVSGVVSDAQGEPLPFCNVYVRGTTTVVVTNDDGYYKMSLPAGTHTIVFQFIGFTRSEQEITITDADLQLNVQLQQELTELEEVIVNADRENPAYAIIRQAIQMRPVHLAEVEGYSCQVYMKGLQKLNSAPDQILGIQLNTIVDVDSNNAGVIYLSESSSTFHFAQPDKTREIMHASLVSGNNASFSWNDAASMQMNLYQNMETLEGFSQRGFVSPIADNALFFYTYRLLSQTYEQGHSIYKIAVEPKRKSDPVYTGVIYITDHQYRISGAQLTLTKENGIEFIDTFHIEQEFFYPDPEYLMLLSSRFSFTYDFFNIKGSGYFHAYYSNYTINPIFPAQFFTGEVTRIEQGANKQDSTYWIGIRPMALTQEEQKDYSEKEALARLKETPAWQDSVDREFNKFKFGQLISGYDYRNTQKHFTISTNPVFDMLQYNTVEGYVVQPRILLRHTPNDTVTWEYTAIARYGTASGGCLFSGGITYRFDPMHKSRVQLQGGSMIRQYHSQGIAPLFNTSYTLLLEENYAKMYGQDHVQLEAESEVFTNGLYLRGGVQYANRYILHNADELQPWVQYERSFSANDDFSPLLSNTYAATPIPDRILTYVQARYVIKQTYITQPNEKFILSAKYPIIQARLQFGAAPDSVQDYHYTQLDATLHDDISLQIAGNLSVTFSYAQQFSQGHMNMADVLHAAGNATIFSRLTETGFFVLPYYATSTDNYLSSAHVQWHTDGFLFRKLPLFKQLKMDPVFSMNMLSSAEVPLYIECAAGVEHLFNIVRIDAAFVPYAGELSGMVSPFRVLIGIGF